MLYFLSKFLSFLIDYKPHLTIIYKNNHPSNNYLISIYVNITKMMYTSGLYIYIFVIYFLNNNKQI